MEVGIYVETILGDLSLQITLLGDVLPELAGVGGAGNSAGETDDDGRVILLNVGEGRHFEREKFRCL